MAFGIQPTHKDKSLSPVMLFFKLNIIGRPHRKQDIISLPLPVMTGNQTEVYCSLQKEVRIHTGHNSGFTFFFKKKHGNMGARPGTDNQINKPVCILAGGRQGNEIKKPIFQTVFKIRRLDPFLLDAGGGQPGEGLKDTFCLFFMPHPAI